MKPGQESQTAVVVCMARAAAHGATSVARYSDPTAFELLPEAAQRQVERFRSEPEPKRFRERLERRVFYNRAQLMVARTVAIDDAIRAAAAPQLVILGAGLDGRAWRMPELSNTIVFEVDHPDSQREKRARVSRLTQVARDVRFVSMDFTRDSLSDALAAAGHDPSRPTTWVWEGVVMYLTPEQVETTLSIIAQQSALGSQLIIAYHRPAFILRVLGPWLRRLGEPLRSRFKPAAMRALLEARGFEVLRDAGVDTIGAELSQEVARVTRRMKHMGIVTARRMMRSKKPIDAESATE